MQSVLITGANKGIGLAIVTKVLSDTDNYIVYLGVRYQTRGNAARNKFLSTNADLDKTRLEVLLIDPANDESVEAAAEKLKEQKITLSAIVNKAGGIFAYPCNAKSPFVRPKQGLRSVPSNLRQRKGSNR